MTRVFETSVQVRYRTVDFGYHELLHAFVIAAAACQYAAVAFFVVE